MKLKKIGAIALSAMMVVAMGAPSVFADEANLNNSSKKVAVTKELKVAEGVNLPTEQFKFNVTKTTTNTAYTGNKEYVSDSSQYADISFAPITVTEADRGTTTPEVIVKESAVDLTNAVFDRAGLFVYEVTEDATADTAGMTYDDSTYYLKVYVKNTANGPKVDEVGVTKDGNKVEAEPQVDPAGDNKTVDETKEATGQFRFVNKYVKNVDKHDEPKDKNPDPNPNDPKNPNPIDKDNTNKKVDGAFVLDKKVLGEFGDQTKDFSFTISVQLPSTADSNFDALAAANVTGATINNGAFTLKHDGQLKLNELPVGTKITVAETNYSAAGYTANWTTSQSDNSLTVLITEDNGGYAICRNAFDDKSVTPTGIVINNLPYVLLIALALGGIVLFTRKKSFDEE